MDSADRLELHELPGRYGDAIDDREAALQEQLSTKRERGKEARAKILEKELTGLAEEREELIEDEMKLRDLGFKKIKEREERYGKEEALAFE